MKEYAKIRAPKESSSQEQHLMGLAGEIAVGAWRGVSFDRRLFPDYEGDDGFDLTVSSKHRENPLRVEVKTTRKSPPERVVTQEEFRKADCFVLCKTVDPRSSVEIVGYAERPLLSVIGEAYGRDGYLLSPENLRPVNPVWIGPEDIRSVMCR